jgi:hypothetical protein
MALKNLCDAGELLLVKPLIVVHGSMVNKPSAAAVTLALDLWISRLHAGLPLHCATVGSPNILLQLQSSSWLQRTSAMPMRAAVCYDHLL